jgi:hypothetical protein
MGLLLLRCCMQCCHAPMHPQDHANMPMQVNVLVKAIVSTAALVLQRTKTIVMVQCKQKMQVIWHCWEGFCVGRGIECSVVCRR